MFKKILYILLGLILLAIIGLTIFISSTPSLPASYEPIIEEVLANDLPELVKGKSGFVENEGAKKVLLNALSC